MCSQRVNIGESVSDVNPCNNQQSTTNYVTNSHVSTLAVPNLPVAPLPNYNMLFSPCFEYPYYSSQPIGIDGTDVPNTMFPSTSLPSALPVPGPQSGPSGKKHQHHLTVYYNLHCQAVHHQKTCALYASNLEMQSSQLSRIEHEIHAFDTDLDTDLTPRLRSHAFKSQNLTHLQTFAFLKIP